MFMTGEKLMGDSWVEADIELGSGAFSKSSTS